jgi:CRP/FNR family transcriptional regulator
MDDAQRVTESRLLADGRNQFILIFLPGDLFAIKSMFITRHPDAVMAISNVVAERMHFKTLHDVYVKDSDVASRCIWQVMEEERRLHRWVVGLGRGSAEERLALL